MRHLSLTAALAFSLAACGSGGDRSGSSNASAEANGAAPAESKAKAAALATCPFRDTKGWMGSLENGRLLVTGTVDLQMAGFKPELKVREAAPPVLRLDLALVPSGGEPVTEKARYERSGSPAYRRGEIWCGGERIAGFDMVIVG